jgi:hypothetical protein
MLGPLMSAVGERASSSHYTRIYFVGPKTSLGAVSKKQIFLEITNCLLSFDTTRTAYKTTRSIILHCSSKVFTEPLPSNDRRYTYRHTDWWEICIYELRRWKRLRCHAMHTKLRKDYSRHSKVYTGYKQTAWFVIPWPSTQQIFQNKPI